MTEQQQPRAERVHIDKVSPYWRNPRSIPTEAVQAVRTSIEQFGYLQPIVVDDTYTVIIGHTRYAALRKMGAENIDVAVVDYLPAAKVKELRVVDNRSGEYTSWNFDALMEELDSLGATLTDADAMLMRGLFPEMGDGVEREKAERAEAVETIEKGEDWRYVVPEVEFTCPTCFHDFEVTVTKDQIMAGRIEADTSEETKA